PDEYDEVLQGEEKEDDLVGEYKKNKDKQEEVEEGRKVDPNSKARELEELLFLNEGDLLTKEEINKDVEEWIKEGKVSDKEDYLGISNRIEENYGKIASDSYTNSQLVSEDMSDEELSQLANSFSMEEVTYKVRDPKIYPLYEVRSPLEGGVEKKKVKIYGDIFDED